MNIYILTIIACALTACATDAQRQRAEKDAGTLLTIGGTVANVAGHPEYGIPASAVGGLLIKDSGK